MANYIDNKEFYAQLIEYRKGVLEAENTGDEVPIIPDDISMKFIQIATNLGSKGNFSGYTYKDEMILDAIENCIKAVHNFDPEKSKNPFAYFTQISWYAFLRRIEAEKKQTYIKYKSLERAVLTDTITEGSSEMLDMSKIALDSDKMAPIIERFEKKKKK